MTRQALNLIVPMALALILWMSPRAHAAVVCDGAPDAFDYLCVSVPYQYTPGITTIAVTGDDSMSRALPIGFTFNYYGRDYTEAYVSTNGFLTLLAGQSNGCCSGQAMPSPGTPNAVIAGLWTDLNPNSGGNIRYGTVGVAPNRRFIVSYDAVQYFGGGGANTFQLVLYENGDVEIHHGSIAASSRTISVGMENESGTIGLQLQNENSAPPSNLGYRLGRISFRADAGGTYNVDEGTEVVTLSAARSRGEIVSYAWDLDNDGEYDDAEGEEAILDTSLLDGPSMKFVGLQVTDINNDISTDTATINVVNVPPTILSEPSEIANINTRYQYELEIVDPAGMADPISFELLEGPPGMSLNIEGVLRWTPLPEDLDQSFEVSLRIDDNDGGLTEQAWTITVFEPDADQDSIPDQLDNCVNDVNVDQLDNDGDLRGDVCDDDDDNDDILDADDNCPFIANTDQLDVDGDEDGNACDDDDDNDFVPDVEDNCPLITNPAQRDTNEDGIGDACENDADRDRVKDDVDNCPEIRNPDQANNDGDDFGDICDDDDDNDGLDDLREETLGTSPFDPDTDNDGLSDGDEVNIYGTDPLTNDADGDDLPDGREVELGTDPRNPDSDGDGLDDRQEEQLETDPTNPDTDDDGLSDGEEINDTLTDPRNPDTDGDGLDDGDEILQQRDPNNPNDNGLIEELLNDDEEDDDEDDDDTPDTPDADTNITVDDTDSGCTTPPGRPSPLTPILAWCVGALWWARSRSTRRSTFK